MAAGLLGASLRASPQGMVLSSSLPSQGATAEALGRPSCSSWMGHSGESNKRQRTEKEEAGRVVNERTGLCRAGQGCAHGQVQRRHGGHPRARAQREVQFKQGFSSLNDSFHPQSNSGLQDPTAAAPAAPVCWCRCKRVFQDYTSSLLPKLVKNSSLSGGNR